MPPCRVSQDQARQAARALDLPTLELACQGFSDERSRMIIGIAWSRAIEREDIPCLDDMMYRIRQSMIWEPESYAKLATIALRFNKSKSMTWLLEYTDENQLRQAVESVVVAKEPVKHDISDALRVIARRHPKLMEGMDLMLHKLDFIDFTAARKDPDLLADILDFSSHASLINFSGDKQKNTVSAFWWGAWSRSDKTDYGQLVFWNEHTQAHPRLSRGLKARGTSLLEYALSGGSTHSKTIVSQPQGTPQYQAMENSFRTGQLTYLATMIHTEPAALAAALKKNTRFAQLVLASKDTSNNNFLHLLSQYRCAPEQSYSKKNLNWERLENWTVKHAAHLLNEKNQDGLTPLDTMSQYPKWRSKFLRALLKEKAREKSNQPSSSVQPPNPRPKM